MVSGDIQRVRDAAFRRGFLPGSHADLDAIETHPFRGCQSVGNVIAVRKTELVNPDSHPHPPQRFRSSP